MTSPRHALVALIALVGVRSDLPRDTLPETLPEELPLGLASAELESDGASPAQVALGRRLFFDGLLSRDESVSCASCHRPDHGFADPRPLSLGVHGDESVRNAPTLFNRALGTSFSWDGNARTLEIQVLQPIENPIEMDLPLDEALRRLAAHDEYPALFAAAFPDGAEGPTREQLATVLSAFVRRLVIGASPVDRYLAGDISDLTPAEKAGLWLWQSRGRCWRCHNGPNFSDESFRNTGVGAEDGAPAAGRMGVTGEDADRGAFKTPTLRGLEFTAPYMHDGSLPTLEDVVEFYRLGGIENSHLDVDMEPIELSEQDAANLVAFLKALSRS